MKITYVIQKSRRRSISVSVMTDNRVLVKAPYGTTERTVQEFLLSKKDWITKHLEKQNWEEEKAESLGLLSADEIKQAYRKMAKKYIIIYIFFTGGDKMESRSNKGIKTFLITSCKGGVGKSTISANLGIRLAHDGWRTLIIDCDFGFTYAFKANWQMLGKIEWDYNSNPGGDTKRSDLRYILGLGYKW